MELREEGEGNGNSTTAHKLTEAEITDAMENAVANLAATFAFGYFDRDDIAQIIRMEIWQLVPKWDGQRSFRAFAYCHAKRRLINLKRDNFWRAETPCDQCHFEGGCIREGDRSSYCSRYTKWLKRNGGKASLARPVDMSMVPDHKVGYEGAAESDAEVNEIIEYIEAHISPSLRGDWLRMRAGGRISSARRRAVEEGVRECLTELGR